MSHDSIRDLKISIQLGLFSIQDSMKLNHLRLSPSLIHMNWNQNQESRIFESDCMPVTMYVASKMKSKKYLIFNPLDELLKRQLEASLRLKVEFSLILDFPKLKSRRLVKSVFLGSD